MMPLILGKWKTLGCAASLMLAIAACSDGTGPISGGGDARISGVLSADGASRPASLAGGTDDDPFSGGSPLRGASVRLVEGSGRVLFDSQTDSAGEFELRAPPGSYRLEISLADGSAFTLEIVVEPGEHLFIQAKVREAGGRAFIDAEIFTDDDADGVSDSGVTIRIVGREAGRPGSGEQMEEGDPDDDLDEEEDDAEDDAPASLSDFQDGQRVLVKGQGEANGFKADEVHGNSGSADRFCRLSGFLIGVQTAPDGSLAGLEIFGTNVGVGGAKITGVRGGKGPDSALDSGTRVEITATLDPATNELEAMRVQGREGSGREAERVSGVLTAPPDVDAHVLQVCGIHVSVTDGATITNGDGNGDEDDDEDDDEEQEDEDDDDDEDEDDQDLSFAEFVDALGAGSFNDEVRGQFDASSGTLEADKLELSADAPEEIEITAGVQDLDPDGGTFTLLGLPVVVVEGTEFKGGNLTGLSDLTDGDRVEVEAEVEDGALVAREIKRAGDPRDRLTGGVLTLVSPEVESDVNFAVELAEGLRLDVDADAATEFEIED